VDLVCGTAGARNNVSRMCVKVPCCAERAAQFSLHHARVGGRTAEGDAIALIVGSRPVKVLQRARRPLKW
jgi:hypothetical protein